MNPLIKGPAEYGLGVSSFQGGPLGGRPMHELDPVVGRILQNFGIRDELPNGRPKPFISSGMEHFLSNTPLSRALTSLRTLSDTKPINRSIDYLIGRERGPDEVGRKEGYQTAANLLSGIRFTTVSPESAERSARALMDKLARDMGASGFTRYTLTRDLREATQETDPEKAARMEAIQEWTRRRQKERRAKFKLQREQKED